MSNKGNKSAREMLEKIYRKALYDTSRNKTRH